MFGALFESGGQTAVTPMEVFFRDRRPASQSSPDPTASWPAEVNWMVRSADQNMSMVLVVAVYSSSMVRAACAAAPELGDSGLDRVKSGTGPLRECVHSRPDRLGARFGPATDPESPEVQRAPDRVALYGS